MNQPNADALSRDGHPAGRFFEKYWPFVVVAVFAVLVNMFWGAFSPLIKFLVCWLGLLAAILSAYWLLRPHRRVDEPLKESHFEKFQRLIGLYHTIPKSILNLPENKAAVEQFDSTELDKWVDQPNGRFKTDNAPDLVHNLYLTLLQIVPIDYLHFNIQAIGSEYRQAVGSTAYEAYLGASKPTDPSMTTEERDRLLRAEATFLVNETRRQQLLRHHAEATRQSLLAAALRSWWVNIVPLMAFFAVFLFCLACVRTARDPVASAQSENWTAYIGHHYFLSTEQAHSPMPPSPYTQLYKGLMIAALLSLAGIAGATGGLMSVIQRVQYSVPESDALTDLWALSQAETAVFFAPVTGLIFAFVLSLFFAGEVLRGTVFPDFQNLGDQWYFVLFSGKSLATWLLWAFLAGFCERLVPDALDTLAKQQSENSSQTPPASARNAPQNQQGTAAEAGIKPVLDVHPDSIPSDATEMTITGRNFDKDTTFYVDSQKMEIMAFSPTTLRAKLSEGALKHKAQVKVMANNPKGGTPIP